MDCIRSHLICFAERTDTQFATSKDSSSEGKRQVKSSLNALQYSQVNKTWHNIFQYSCFTLHQIQVYDQIKLQAGTVNSDRKGDSDNFWRTSQKMLSFKKLLSTITISKKGQCASTLSIDFTKSIWKEECWIVEALN